MTSYGSLIFTNKKSQKGGDCKVFKMKNMPWTLINLEEFGEKMEYKMFLMALRFCIKAFHEGEWRKDGRPYETHPMRVAQILIYFGIIDEITLIIALLHDIPEHIGIKFIEEIEGSYGREIADNVRLLTRTKGQDFGEYCEDILQSLKAILVKLADRLHNFRNMIKRIGTGPFFTEDRLDRQRKETDRHIIPMAEKAIILYPESAEVIGRMLKELKRAVQMANMILE